MKCHTQCRKPLRPLRPLRPPWQNTRGGRVRLNAIVMPEMEYTHPEKGTRTCWMWCALVWVWMWCDLICVRVDLGKPMALCWRGAASTDRPCVVLGWVGAPGAGLGRGRWVQDACW